MRHDYRDLYVDELDRVPYCLCGWVGRPGDTYERHQAFIKHLKDRGAGDILSNERSLEDLRAGRVVPRSRGSEAEHE